MTASRIGGDALAAADALGRQRIGLPSALHERGRLAGDARAGGAEGMAERDGPAVDIGLGPVDASDRRCRRAPATAKASLSSITSMSLTASIPARARALRVAATGPMPMISGAQPATAMLWSLRRAARAHGPWRSPRCRSGCARAAVGQRRGGAGGHRRRPRRRRASARQNLRGRSPGGCSRPSPPRCLPAVDRDDLIGELAGRLAPRRRAAGCATANCSCSLAADLVFARRRSPRSRPWRYRPG